MGDPRRLKRKYRGPEHPWQKTRIEEEKRLFRTYGLASKTEIWKASSKLRGFANQAKKLIALRGDQVDKETKQLLSRLTRLGLLPSGAALNDVLGLTIKDILNRRLQTVVFKKSLARTPSQARQFITHQHVMVNNKIVSTPSYLVPAEHETSITFTAKSGLANPDHPERPRAKDTTEKKDASEEKSASEKPEAEKTEEPAVSGNETTKTTQEESIGEAA